jgi:predicted nucleotidyltransferase
MAKIINDGKAIQLQAENSIEKRLEWRPWKAKGYRILDKDDETVWAEDEVIRREVVSAFAGYDVDIFLFGSRASGAVHKRSDYDIGYLGKSLPSASQLARLADLLEELPIPAHVELVDFSKVGADFKKIALDKDEVQVWKKSSTNSIFN